MSNLKAAGSRTLGGVLARLRDAGAPVTQVVYTVMLSWVAGVAPAPGGPRGARSPRRGARGRAEAASSGDWATAGLENVLDRVDGEAERSPARARRAPPAAVAMAGVDGL